MRNPKHDKLQPLPLKKQVVAGFVIFRRTTDGLKFLLLYRRGQYWNFPKGHFEEGETKFDVALRELEEETGLKKTDLRIIPNFRAYERYHFKVDNQRIHDTVILFLAETHKAEITIRPREHSGYAWFLAQDAIATIGKKYEDVARVLRQAKGFLEHRRRPQPQQQSNPERKPQPQPHAHRPHQGQK